MKTRYKIILLVLVVVLGVAGGIYYKMQPLPIAAQAVSQGVLSEILSVQGDIVPKESVVVNANATGVVRLGSIFPGKTVNEGDVLITIDNTLVREQMENQIKTLKLQQSSLYAQDGTARIELELRQEQLKAQLTAAQQDYNNMFGKDGTSKSLLSIARNSYLLSRRNYNDANSYYNGREDDDDEHEYEPGRSELYALRNQMNIAQENLIMAEGNSAQTTQAYYKDMIASCELQLEILGGNVASSKNSIYAAVQQLQVTIDDLTTRLEPAPIGAPCSGVVWELMASDGEYIAENAPIAKLYPAGKLRIESLIPAQDALALRVGDIAAGRLANGTEFSASVSFISPVARETVSTIGLSERRCVVELDALGLPSNVGAGHRVDIDFTFLKSENALSVPSGCIVPMDAGSGVYVARERIAVLIPIETGVTCNGRTEILSGVAQGEEVITDPYDAKLKEGGRITLQ